MREYAYFAMKMAQGIDIEGEDLLLAHRKLDGFGKGCRLVANDGPLFIFPCWADSAVPDRFKVRDITNKTVQFYSDKSAQTADLDLPLALYNQQNFQDQSYVIITEGEWDALSWISLGYTNSCSLPNGASSAKAACRRSFKYLNQFKTIYLNFDADDAGRKATKEALEVLPKYKVKVVSLPTKDMNDWIRKGVTKSDAAAALSNAKGTMLDTVMPSSAFDVAEVLSATPQGLSTGFYEVDRILGGLRPREVTTVSGDTGVGKTTWTVNIARNLANKNIKTWIASQEMDHRKILQKAASIELRLPLRKGVALTPDNLDYLKRWMEKGVIHVHPSGYMLRIDTLLEELDYFAYACGGAVAIIEDIGYLATSVNDTEGHERYEYVIKAMKQKAMETGLHILALAHPTKTDDKSMVGMGHIKGSAGIKQYSDNVIIVTRLDRIKPDQKNKVMIDIQKNREFGQEGYCILEYMPEYDGFIG